MPVTPPPPLSQFWANGQPLAESDEVVLQRFIEASDQLLASEAPDSPGKARLAVAYFEPLLRKYEGVDVSSIADPKEQALVSALRTRFAQLQTLADQPANPLIPTGGKPGTDGTEGLSPPNGTFNAELASATLQALALTREAAGKDWSLLDVDVFITAALQYESLGYRQAANLQGANPAGKEGDKDAGKVDGASQEKVGTEKVRQSTTLMCMLVLLECMIELAKISSTLSAAQSQALVEKLTEAANNIKKAGEKAFDYAVGAAVVQMVGGLVQMGCGLWAARARFMAKDPANAAREHELLQTADCMSAIAASLDSLLSHGTGGIVKAWGDNEVAKIQAAGEHLKAAAEVLRNTMEKSAAMSRSAAEAFANILSAIAQMLQSTVQTDRSVMTFA